MHMIARDYAFDDDVHSQLTTKLTDDLADTKTERPLQHRVAILGDPDDMLTMIKIVRLQVS